MKEDIRVVQEKHVEYTKQLKRDYEELFDSPRGQRVLRDIQASGVMFRNAFSSDALVMAANCAKQEFARHICEMAKKAEPEPEKPKKAIRKSAKK